MVGDSNNVTLRNQTSFNRGAFAKQGFRFSRKNILRVAACLVFAIVLYAALIAVSIWTFADVDETQQADAAIVLGASIWDDEPSPVFAERINHSIWLYENGYIGKIIFTGGIAEGASYSESSVARNFAIERGIPAQSIFIEEHSTITQENFYYAVQIIEESTIESVLIVSDPLHMRRAMLMANDNNLEAYSSPTRTSSYQSLQTQLPFLARETFFYIGYQMFGRLW